MLKGSSSVRHSTIRSVVVIGRDRLTARVEMMRRWGAVLRCRSVPLRISAIATALPLLLLAVPVAVLIGAPAATAAAPTGFEIDGDQADSANVSGLDWQTATPGVLRDAVGQVDASTITGSEAGGEASWSLGSPGSASGKSDVGNVMVTAGVDQLSHEWLYMAFDRAAPTGTAAFYFELNAQQPVVQGGIPRPVRSVGDLRIKLATSGSSTVACEAVQQWTGTTWGTVLPCPTSYFFSAVNTVPITDYYGSANASGGQIPANEFIEVGLDLTGIGAANCAGGSAYTSMMVRTATTDSESGQLSDFASGKVTVPSRCAQLTIVKQGQDGKPVPGVQFTVTPNPATGTGSTTVTTGADGTYTFGSVEPGPPPATAADLPWTWLTYTVAETAVPASSGYLQVHDDPSDPGTWQPQGSPRFGEVLTKAPQADAIQKVAVQPMGQYTMGVIDPLAWQAPTVAMTVTASHDLTRTWTVKKSVVGADSSGTFTAAEGSSSVTTTFDVAVTEGATTTSAQRAAESISVTNPNSVPLTVTLAGVLDGATCSVNATDVDPSTPGVQVKLSPGANGPYAATCTDSGPPAGTASATVTWSHATYPSTQAQYDSPSTAGTGTATTGEQPFSSPVADPGPQSVQVYDQFTQPAAAETLLGTVAASGVGTTTHFTVSRSIPVTIGACSPVSNDAYLKVNGTEIARSTATTQACGPKPNVLVQKLTGSSGGTWTPVDGSQWEVLTDASGTPGPPMTTVSVAPRQGVTGGFLIHGIPVGTYWLEETVAPHGDSLLAQPVKFAVAAGGAVTVSDGAGSGANATATASRTSDGTWQITVRDYPALKLPFTGGQGSSVYVAAGAAALVLAALLGLGPTVRRRARSLRRPVRPGR